MLKSEWKEFCIPQLPKVEPTSPPGRFDVVIIGGGITGLSAAYFLRAAGKRVCVLERDRIGGGDTGSTSAHLTAVTDIRLSELVDSYGENVAALVWGAGDVAVNSIETIIHNHDFDCEFRRVPGYLTAPLKDREPRKSDLELLVRDLGIAEKIGVDAQWDESIPVLNRPGVRFNRQGKIHPLKYLAGLAGAITEDGDSKIFENSEVTEVQSEARSVVANGVRIECDHVIVATHVPITGDRNVVSSAMFQTKITPYSSYLIEAKLPANSLPEHLLWDTADPYHYWRIDKRSGRGGEYESVIFGGKDHKTGQTSDTEKVFAELAACLRDCFPNATVERRWSGQVIETHDGLPFIGEAGKNQFIATGYCGNGLTFGTLAGLMAHDFVLGKANPWKEIFSPGRKEIRAGGAWNYVRENIDYPAYLIGDRLKPLDHSPDDIKKGEGRIIKIDGKKVACARDDRGQLHAVSAVCTHLGCLVRWNGGEATWDCPCHGSRFRPNGEVLAGPAEAPLPPVTISGK